MGFSFGQIAPWVNLFHRSQIKLQSDFCFYFFLLIRLGWLFLHLNSIQPFLNENFSFCLSGSNMGSKVKSERQIKRVVWILVPSSMPCQWFEAEFVGISSGPWQSFLTNSSSHTKIPPKTHNPKPKKKPQTPTIFKNYAHFHCVPTGVTSDEKNKPQFFSDSSQFPLMPAHQHLCLRSFKIKLLASIVFQRIWPFTSPCRHTNGDVVASVIRIILGFSSFCF